MTSTTIAFNSADGTDEELIKAVQSGHQEAFELIVKRHQNRLFNLIHWFLGDYSDATDMTQEVFIKIYKALPSFRFEAAFSTWSYRIAINTCKNRVNSLEYRFKRQLRRIGRRGEIADRDMISEPSDETQNPYRDLVRKERIQLIRRCIQRMSPAKRTMIILRDIEGMSYEEIAALLNLKLGTVKSKISRARLALRDLLQKALRHEM
jgi:RNA polymerase sigma-70 factor (ECF subfamily)